MNENYNNNYNYNYNIENKLNKNNIQHPFDFNEDYNNTNINNNNYNEKENINNKELNNIIKRFEKINENKNNFFQSFEFYTNKTILILFIFFIFIEIFFIIIVILSKTILFKILTIIISVLIIIFLFIPYGIIISYNSMNKKILIHKKCILDCICYNNFNNYFDIQNIKIFFLQKIEGCCILKYQILYSLKTSTNHKLLCSIQNEFIKNENFEKNLLSNIEQMNKWIYL